MRKTIIGVLVALGMMACEDKTPNTMFPELSSKKDIKYTQIVLDTIVLKDSTSSYVGQTFINDGKIFFADEYFCFVYEFDTKGQLIAKHLGQGKSEKELSMHAFIGSCVWDNGQSVYLGNEVDLHVYNKDFKRTTVFQVTNYFDKVDPKNPYEYADTYSYALDKFVVRGHDDFVYLNVVGDSPGVNSVEYPEMYYKNAHLIMKIGVKSKNVEALLGKYSPLYSDNYANKGLLYNTTFDIDNDGNFYICCEADSAIYVYDSKYEPQYGFGYQGLDMDTNYAAVHTFDEVNQQWEATRNKGLYDWVEYIDETGLLFRSYTKSETAAFGGLQIYSDNTLLADVDVPKGMRVVGYIAPYYYSQVNADPDTKTLKIYRFKL